MAVYSEADATPCTCATADEAVLLGPAPAAESYLRAERILAAAQQTGAQAIHPGYGFLSRERRVRRGLRRGRASRFIGPTPEQIRRFGLKHLARELAVGAGRAAAARAPGC